MSIAAANPPLPRRTQNQKKLPRRCCDPTNCRKKLSRRVIKKTCRCHAAPAMVFKTFFDFQSCDWSQLELLLLINQIR
jgi:hypothetical protein